MLPQKLPFVDAMYMVVHIQTVTEFIHHGNDFGYHPDSLTGSGVPLIQLREMSLPLHCNTHTQYNLC